MQIVYRSSSVRICTRRIPVHRVVHVWTFWQGIKCRTSDVKPPDRSTRQYRPSTTMSIWIRRSKTRLLALSIPVLHSWIKTGCNKDNWSIHIQRLAEKKNTATLCKIRKYDTSSTKNDEKRPLIAMPRPVVIVVGSGDGGGGGDGGGFVYIFIFIFHTQNIRMWKLQNSWFCLLIHTRTKKHTCMWI